MAKILIVDDNKALSLSVADWLTFEKHEVTLVHSGLEGWDQIKSNAFDLAILDWEMPDLQGVDILKRFRASGGTTPVLMLTGRKAIDDKEMGFEAGANDYLTKPFHIKELGMRVKAILRTQTAIPAKPKALGSGNEAVLKKGNLSETSLAAKYEFLEVIGEGGVAIVFKARHPHLDKTVAIKMLQGLELGEEVTARFEREAKVVSKLEHPNIVTVHDFGITENKQPYMVMEYINGQDLEQAISNAEFGGGLPLDQALPILTAASAGLAHAHEHGILHRDIKPSNIVLKPIEGGGVVPKLLDFGLAKLTGWEAKGGAKLTQDQQILGSPAYMSPDLLLGKPVDARSDIYSFGCVIFEVVTGFTPFVGETAVEVATKRLTEPPLTFFKVQPDRKYPPEIVSLVARMLDLDPQERPQTMKEVHDELAQIDLTPQAAPQKEPGASDSSIWKSLKKFKPF